MFKYYKKLFFALVALFSVFILASCSQDQSASQTEAPKVETIDGEWELVNAVDALSDSIGAYPLNALNFARLLDSVKDFKMDLKTIRQRLNTIIILITLVKLSISFHNPLKERLKKSSKKPYMTLTKNLQVTLRNTKSA